MTEEKKTILLVDDDPNVLEMIYEGLLSENFDVISAANPDEALKKIQGRTLDFALLDLDLGWNYMTGIELGQKLREVDQNLVIIIMTGYHTRYSYKREAGYFQLTGLCFGATVQRILIPDGGHSLYQMHVVGKQGHTSCGQIP